MHSSIGIDAEEITNEEVEKLLESYYHFRYMPRHVDTNFLRELKLYNNINVKKDITIDGKTYNTEKHFKNLIVMLGTILYIAGLVLAILAVLDILKKPISLVGKIICCVLVLITSWVGLLVYYLYAKDHIVEWFK